ncbi:MAG: helix-turn-helix transcriptional regulator, partial [Oscillospiraceae bacterium]|nr:helix-turn-helix transcriptional regulator [Oscillospiraceae bacterium]
YILYFVEYPFIEVIFMKHADKFHKLALNIAYYRKKQGLTQLQFAESLGVSRTHISNIEAPNYPVSFSMNLLFDMADVLEVEPELLFNFR